MFFSHLDQHSERKLYLDVLPPQFVHHTLAFVGWAVPYTSAYNNVNEMQARFATKVFKKEAMLPSRQKMDEEIDRAMSARYKQFGTHIPWAVSFITFTSELHH